MRTPIDRRGRGMFDGERDFDNDSYYRNSRGWRNAKTALGLGSYVVKSMIELENQIKSEGLGTRQGDVRHRMMLAIDFYLAYVRIGHHGEDPRKKTAMREALGFVGPSEEMPTMTIDEFCEQFRRLSGPTRSLVLGALQHIDRTEDAQSQRQTVDEGPFKFPVDAAQAVRS